MILGPPELINCPFCNTLYQKQSLISGNTFGGMHFSDGQHFYPMLPSQPQLSVCDVCLNFFWVKDLESLSNMRDYDGDEDPPYVRWPEQEEWMRALSLGIQRNKDEETYIRTHIWWILNNKFRSEDASYTGNDAFPEKFYQENLFALLRLRLNENEPDQLLLAEIYRELGYFDKAIELIKEVKDDHLRNVAARIREKALQKNPLMFKLP
jgi:hypothetical protein